MKETEFGENYLIDYQAADTVNTVHAFLNKYNSIILKPVIGSFGRKIIVVDIIGNQFVVTQDFTKQVLNSVDFNEYLSTVLSKEKMIIQQFIKSQTKDDQPFDIRIHMMKGKNIEWNFVDIYPRVGINPIRINPTGQGGYIGGIIGFLERNYSKEQASVINEELKSLGYQCVYQLEKIYNKEIFEVGIDVAIDKAGKLYSIEANLKKPGVIYFEFDLAKHAIPYCKELVK